MCVWLCVHACARVRVRVSVSLRVLCLCPCVTVWLCVFEKPGTPASHAAMSVCVHVCVSVCLCPCVSVCTTVWLCVLENTCARTCKCRPQHFRQRGDALIGSIRTW